MKQTSLLTSEMTSSTAVIPNKTTNNKTTEISTFKLVICGDRNVGKTSLIHQWIYNKYEQDIQAPTIGCTHFELNYKVDAHKLSLQLWDISGNDKYRPFHPLYFNGAQVGLALFALHLPLTLTRALEYVEDLQNVQGMEYVYYKSIMLNSHKTRRTCCQLYVTVSFIINNNCGTKCKKSFMMTMNSCNSCNLMASFS
jgi:small GTP-binding protein